MVTQLPAKTFGKDFNFYRVVASGDIGAAFPPNAQVVFNFRAQFGFSLFVTGADVEYSFNGNTVHGELLVGTPREYLQFDYRRVSGIWLRSAGAATVRVEAWASGL